MVPLTAFTWKLLEYPLLARRLYRVLGFSTQSHIAGRTLRAQSHCITPCPAGDDFTSHSVPLPFLFSAVVNCVPFNFIEKPRLCGRTRKYLLAPGRHHMSPSGLEIR